MAPLPEHAFAEFYRREARPLWTYVYRATGSAADADDVVQEAFMRVLTAELAGLGDEELRRYLFRVAGNIMTDRWRRERRARTRRERAPQQPGTPSPRPDDLDVARTFAQLKPRERALLWLAYVEGEAHDQIADALGVTRGSVKVLLSRARARLRDLLAARGLGART